MRFYIFIFFFLIGLNAFSQQDILAKQYFNEGDFEKAVLYYETLHKNIPERIDYLQYLAACYQQLERYKDAEQLLIEKLEKPYNQAVIHIELGYNYALQKDEKNAKKNYDKALNKIDERPSYAYITGESFRKKLLLDYAIKAFKKGITLRSDKNFTLNYNIASIYGEMGDIEAMYTAYLDIIAQNKRVLEIVKRRLGNFIVEDPEAENNMLLRKSLLKRIQTSPDVTWNKLLSWLFIQQQQYNTAFIQEKAIYKRVDTASLDRIMQLGVLAAESRNTVVARNIFEFALDNAINNELKIKIHSHLLQLDIDKTSAKDYPKIKTKFLSLFDKYGYTTETLSLQTAYARFLTFQRNESAKAITLLKNALKLPLNQFQQANIKMILGDILVYEAQFNQALIYYAQIQKLLKNNVLSQSARYKTAQASFYKGDFEWAETQLKVLKSSTSQLIANDALQLKLLISDNAYEDSTQTALKLYAKASLFAYQKKTDSAIAVLDKILITHKGETIEDEALLKQAELLELLGSYKKAEYNYLKIIEFYPYDILIDDALFSLAQLYEKVLNMPEKAKIYYEKLIFEHQDSIYFVDARKRYRMLRGDAVSGS